MSSMRNRNNGFTLIELLVALAAMALLSIMSWRGIDGMLRAQE
jgi:general secretion pathway protein J